MTSVSWRRNAAILATALVVTATAGCGWQGVNSLSLPGTEGNGPGSYEIQAQMPDVSNIQPNSRVRVADVTVGHVTKIELQGGHALVTMRLSGDVVLPENATAKIGLTTIFGSLHIELAPPPDVPAHGTLHGGSVIPLSRASAYPTPEQTLASVSLVLNGGGLAQVGDITEALSTAFKGREKDLRSLITQLNTFAGNLNNQTSDITAASDSLNQVAAKIAAQKPILDQALKAIPDALAVLDNERGPLVDAATELGKFSALTTDTVNQSKDNLLKELTELQPVLEQLANAGPGVTRSLGLLPIYPFPSANMDKWQRGDYANLTAIIDLTLSRLDASFFGSSQMRV